MDKRQQYLASLNDERLGPFIAAGDDHARAVAVEGILSLARPTIRGVLGHARTTVLRAEDIEDIESSVDLRLFRRLETARLYEDDCIRSLDEFVATLTYNVIYDVMRRRFPERTRLKNRLRYLFTHDPRFALWQGDAAMLCGPTKWRDRAPADARHGITRENASPAMLARDAPADALLALFERTRAPLPLEQVIDLAAELWSITDAALPIAAELADEAPTPLDRVQSRQYLTALWKEIVQLRPQQRTALLLNLRDHDGGNALGHLLAAGIATMEDIARAVGMSREELAAVWDGLPMADAVIAETLSLTRQQVINLRKAARERLARRLK
jgi:hypothetical protein